MGEKSTLWDTSPKITLSKALQGCPHLQLGPPSLRANTSPAIPSSPATALPVPISTSQGLLQPSFSSQWALVGLSSVELAPQALRGPVPPLVLASTAVLVFLAALVHPTIPVAVLPRDPAPHQALALSVAAPALSQVEKSFFSPAAASPALLVTLAFLCLPQR